MTCRIPSRRSLLGVVALGLLVGLSGCQSGTSERRRPVSGKVTVKSRPLPAGITVVFIPNAEKGNRTMREPRAQTDAKGIYQLFSNHQGKENGAPSG